MIASLLNALFAIGGVVALAAIGMTLRDYGRSALALCGATRTCGNLQHVHFRVSELTVTAGSNVLRPEFTVRKAFARQQDALLAAA